MVVCAVCVANVVTVGIDAESRRWARAVAGTAEKRRARVAYLDEWQPAGGVDHADGTAAAVGLDHHDCSTLEQQTELRADHRDHGTAKKTKPRFWFDGSLCSSGVGDGADAPGSPYVLYVMCPPPQEVVRSAAFTQHDTALSALKLSTLKLQARIAKQRQLRLSIYP